MATIDIFNDIYRHQIEGVMFHEKVAMMYDFMGLKGYKRVHEYHTMDEFINARSTQRYAVNHLDKMIDAESINSPLVIPMNWRTAGRFDVGENDRKTMVAKLFEKWRAWETDTKKFYEDRFKALTDMGEIACANKVNMLIKDVDTELKRLEREYLDLKAVGFDMVHIMERQDKLHDEYAEKMREIGVEFN